MTHEYNAEPATMVSGLGSAALVDAMGRSHQHRAHILSLVSPTPQRPLFGPAVTIAYPYRDDIPDTNALGLSDFSCVGAVMVFSSG